MSGLKAYLRDMLPGRAQVPVKYRLDQLRGYLEAEMCLLDYLISAGDRAIDVGGNRGVYAYRLRKLGALVEIFEPNPICLAVLKSWVAGRTGLALHAVALSNQEGAANLHIPVDEFGVEHDASGTLEGGDFSNERDLPIELRLLDSYQFADVSLIKIDVEGHETKVIEGAAQTIRLSQPALLVEIEQRHLKCSILDVFGMMRDLGYHGYFLIEGVLHSIEVFDVKSDQCQENLGRPGARYINNFLFLHEQRFLKGQYKELMDRYAAG